MEEGDVAPALHAGDGADPAGHLAEDGERAVARGESILDPTVTAKVVAEFARLANQTTRPEALVNPLSDREIEVLRLVAKGATNAEIAATLFIAEGTVRNHLTNILGKLGVSDRTQAAVKAKELGLV